MRYETEKLVKIYQEHGNIVVGVDFDDTVFPFTDKMFVEDRCREVRNLLLSVKDSILLCLYTVSDKETLKYKHHIMIYYGLDPDFINDSPVGPWSQSKKLFFNLLLDDKAGLNESMEILREFKQEIEKL